MPKQKQIKQIKVIERHLRNYKQYKIGLKTLKKQLDYIMPNITVDYTIEGGANGTFNITSDTEKFAIDRIESKKAIEIHENMERYRIIIESIDDALEELDSIEKEFVELRYIKRYSIPKVSLEMGFHEQSIFYIRNRIMEKLLISLHGLMQI